MKVSIKSIIFATVLGSLLTVANVVRANDQDSVKNGVLLAKGTEVDFANFMNKNAKNFVKKEDWNIFTNVVTLYNVSPSRFLGVNTEKKENFNDAVKNIKVKLSKMRGDEAKEWMNKVTVTANVINFLWNYKAEIAPIESENEAPTPVQTIGE